MMLVRVLMTAACFIPAFFLAMRYNMHMFQLNGYKNGEHINWIKKNIRRQWVLVTGIVIGIIGIAVPCQASDIVCCLELLLVAFTYNAMRKMSTKKKLVYTARVKRMIATLLAITGVILAAVGLLAGMECLAGVMVILVSAQFFMNIAVNVVNYPMEAAVRQHYINDAKSRLKKSPELIVVGVTGSYGKTSVKFYLQTLLQARFNVLVTPESYNTPMGVVMTIRGSLKASHEIFICEMGARHVGDIKEICDIVRPRHGMITSIGPQHLETFFNMENIQSTKFELADALPAGGLLFLNGDNDYIQQKAQGYSGKVFYYAEGADKAGGYYAKDICVSQFGTEFTVVTPDGETERFQTKLIGAHNVINIVGAITVANKLGMPLGELRVPVRRIQPVAHRMQMREHGAVTIIDDAYNSNPVGSKAAVETLAMFDGIRILVTPGMVELGDKEAEYNRKFGEYAADCCDYILLVGRKHTAPIKEGALDKGFSEEKCRVYDKLEDALAYAYAVKGQGHKYILLENDLPDNY